MIKDMDDYGVYTDVVDIVFEEELEDSDVEQDEHTNTNISRKCRNLTERQQIYEALLERSNRGKLKKNTTKIVADMFQVNRYQVRGVWRRAKQCRAQDRPVDVRSWRKNRDRKRIQIDVSNVLRVP
jgi:hypothetical protein